MFTLLSFGKKKNIKINSDFETDSSLDESLINKLKHLKENNDERFSILMKNLNKKIVYRDINALAKDMEYFRIVKKYEDDFKKTTYIEKLYQSNLVNCYDSPQEFEKQLSIRKSALQQLNDHPINNEIILKMIHSSRFYSSEEWFMLELRFRWNAINLMNYETIHHDHNKFRYHSAEKNYLQLNESYWDKPKKKQGFFLLKKGVQPSAAINSIFDETSQIVLECHSMMLSIQYKALLNTIGSDQFDLLFKEKPLIISDGFHLTDQYKENLDEIYNYQYKIKKEELIPGDWVYLANFPDYNVASLYDDSKDGAGLHSMAMGNSQFRGFGLSRVMTEAEMKQNFLSIYNNDFRAYPVELTVESIDDKTMGLENPKMDLRKGDEVIIYGHILCPSPEWSKVACIYKDDNKFDCKKLNIENATENEIVFGLLKMHNSFLPEKKTENDLLMLDIFRSISTKVRRINFMHDRFRFLFQNDFISSKVSNHFSALFSVNNHTSNQNLTLNIPLNRYS